MPAAQSYPHRDSDPKRAQAAASDMADKVVDKASEYATKAGEKLGWEPTVDFRQLVRLMVDADLEVLRKNGGAS